MRKGFKSFVFLTSLATAASFTITACKPSSPAITVEFSFNVATTVKGAVYLGQDEQIQVIETKDKNDKTVREYQFYLLDDTDEKYLTVSSNGNIHPVSLTPKKGDIKEEGEDPLEEDYEVGIGVYETQSEIFKALYLKVTEKYKEANGGYNFSSATWQEKSKILGKLEEYAMSNFLTGISLFENGGYVRYSPRVHLPTQNYITGFGFGLLSEGHLKESTWEPSVSGDKDYLRTASSSDPLDINAWMATGSQVSDLNGYISSSYWGTKIHPTDPTKYVWYPVLAQDDCVDPVAVVVDDQGVEHELKTKADFEQYGKSIFKTWRLYVKTDEINYRAAEGASSAMKTLIEGDSDSDTPATRHVSIDDYEFVFKLLLTGATKLVRGTELASDTSYGFKGAYSYNIRTENYSGTSQDDYDEIDDAWESMKANGTLGIKTSKDLFKSKNPTTGKYEVDESAYNSWKLGGKKDYIQFEFINPLDQFTAKYTLSSNLYSPIPQDFMGKIGGNISGVDEDDKPITIQDANWIKGATNFGRFAGQSIADRVICLGPYHLDYWTKGLETAFKRSDDWFECDTQEHRTGRYQIPGVHIKIVEKTSEEPDAIYSEFLQGKFDSTGIPSNRMSELLPTDKKTRGDSTFKLNVNACDQDRWNELFGTNGKIKKQNDDEYLVKPFMSNLNFLNGLFWSIDRPTFAAKRGVSPSYDYFADSYLISPDEGKSYNTTQAHEDAVTNFGIDVSKNDYGYNYSKAVKYFKAAVSELTKQGLIKYGSSKDNPTVLNLDIQWMYPSDKYEYGQDIGKNFEDAFNDEEVSNGLIKLKVNHNADQVWTDVYYNHLMVGKFDLGFGAISGNSLNPLNFMEVLRSDNSSGFTLNWGADTAVFDEKHPINYGTTDENKREWSFDALWAAADHGSVVYAGKETKLVTTGYVSSTTDLDGNDTSDFRNGAIIRIPFNFVGPVDDAFFKVERIQLFLIGAGTYSITKEHIRLLNGEGKVITSDDEIVAYIELEFTAEMAAEINAQIYKGRKYEKEVKKLYDKDGKPLYPDSDARKDDFEHKFTYDNYYSKRTKAGLWMIEIYYSVHIAGSEETEAEYDVLKNESDDPTSARLARF